MRVCTYQEETADNQFHATLLIKFGLLKEAKGTARRFMVKNTNCIEVIFHQIQYLNFLVEVSEQGNEPTQINKVRILLHICIYESSSRCSVEYDLKWHIYVSALRSNSGDETCTPSVCKYS